jgi:hypothetical protein
LPSSSPFNHSVHDCHQQRLRDTFVLFSTPAPPTKLSLSTFSSREDAFTTVVLSSSTRCSLLLWYHRNGNGRTYQGNFPAPVRDTSRLEFPNLMLRYEHRKHSTEQQHISIPRPLHTLLRSSELCLCHHARRRMLVFQLRTRSNHKHFRLYPWMPRISSR